MDTKIIPFASPEDRDMDRMDPQELREYLQELRQQIAALDKKEPRNMESEAYETWADRHEELEDLVDEILDRLEM